jgi:hypothetical protein
VLQNAVCNVVCEVKIAWHELQEEKNDPKMSWDSIFEKSQKNMRFNGLAWANTPPPAIKIDCGAFLRAFSIKHC